MKESEMKDGGSAFPIFNERGISYFGMTLRDYFAGQALVGLMGNSRIYEDSTFDNIARHCYKTADAMIEKRKMEK